MLSKRSFGIAGAAMLGTVALLGTNAANAAIMLDEDADAVVYAIETVSDTVDDDDMYYTVRSFEDGGSADPQSAGDPLDIRGVGGVGAAQDESLVVTFTLSGMVFGEALTSGSLGVHPRTVAQDGTVTLEASQLVDGEVVLRTGGEAGGTSAVFGISNGDGDIDKTDEIVLNIESLGVSMGGGTVTMMVEHEDGRSQTTSDPGMVQLMTGLVENGDAMNAMTFVETSYTDFGESGTPDNDTNDTVDATRLYVDTLGSFTIAADHLDAANGTSATLGDVLGAAAFDPNDTIAMGAASVTMSGDAFSFAEAVWLDTAVGCANEASATALLEDDGDITAVAVKTLGSGSDLETNAPATIERFLCIRVEDDSSTTGMATGLTTIPRTGPYMAMTTYSDDGMHPPMDGSIELGRIIRDGTMVELPYLTTDDRYNQRIIIVNRSNEMVHYYMDFTSEDGIEAERGTDGIGNLAADSTTVLHLRRHDVVRITGGPPNRAAGTLTLEAEEEDISVATNQTNAMDGGTDTVILH